MRAKEILHKHMTDKFIVEVSKKFDHSEVFSPFPKWMEEAMQEYALQIAEQAAGELIQGKDWVDMDSLDRLISRIKTLTEQ